MKNNLNKGILCAAVAISIASCGDPNSETVEQGATTNTTEVKPEKREIPEEESNKDLAEAVEKSLDAEVERIIQIGDKQERETATK